MNIFEARNLIAHAEAAAERIQTIATAEGWPDHGRALADWLAHGCHPGQTLAAMVDGDMWQFVGRADLTTWKHARDIARTLWSHAPRGAIGAPGVATVEGACERWIDEIQEARMEVEEEAMRARRDAADPANVADLEHAQDEHEAAPRDLEARQMAALYAALGNLPPGVEVIGLSDPATLHEQIGRAIGEA